MWGVGRERLAIERAIPFVASHGVNFDNVAAGESGFPRLRRLMESGPKSNVEAMEIPNEVRFFEGHLSPLERTVTHELTRNVE